MRPVTLRNGLVLVVVATLLPIGTLSVVQALASLRYSRSLISDQLVTNALATAVRERDPLIISKQLLLTLSANNAVRAGSAECDQALKMGLSLNPALLNVARSDAQGRVLCSVLPFDPATSFANDAWWKRGIREPTLTVSALVTGKIAKKRVLIGMQPVTNADGSNFGAVTVAIDASWLERALPGSDMTADAVVAIIDRSGNTLLTSATRRLPRFVIKGGHAAVIETRAADGVAWMYAIAPLFDRELYVVYAETSEQLMATALQQVRISLLLPIFALLLASLAIWIGTHHLVLRWLESLRSLAAQFAQGNFTGDPHNYINAPRELALLSADLHIMAQAIDTRDHALQAALDAKTVLTHDIHHRVKNNLQIVSSLLDLQAGKISDPTAREALNQTRARIGALAQIHRLLYEESHDSDHGNVNIAKLLGALCSQLRALNRGQGGVHLTCEASSQLVPINNAVPVTLLAVEAVTNAFRHGFRAGQSGAITLGFDITDDRATLSVSDDGLGFDVEHNAASMGRQLMDAFAQQLGGELHITSAPGQGTLVKLVYRVHPAPPGNAVLAGAYTIGPMNPPA